MRPGTGEPTPQGRMIEELLRARYLPLKRAHLAYCHSAIEALTRRGVPVACHADGRLPGLRSTITWLDPHPARLLWLESTGWALLDPPTTRHAPRYAPLGILADPRSVAAWTREALYGQAQSPSSPEPITRRTPTSPDVAIDDDLRFEQRLAGFGGIGTGVKLKPIPPGEQQSAYAWNWDQPFRHRCLACEAAAPGMDTLSNWTRPKAAFIGRVVFTPASTAVTGWCQLCIPAADPHREGRRDELLITEQTSGRLPGGLLTSRHETQFCPCCLDPWIPIPTTSPPLTTGTWPEVCLSVHPCPWCWHADEQEARRAQQLALTRCWDGP